MKKNVPNFRHISRHFFAIIFCLVAQTPRIEAQIPIFTDGKNGLVQVFTYILEGTDAQRDSLTAAVAPTLRDYYVVFDSAFAQELHTAHRRYHRLYDFSIRPHRKEETAFVIFEASAQALAEYVGDAQNFPGGYRELATQQHLRSGITYYRVRMIKPGRRMGTSYDVWAFVGGRWCLFLRPWHLLVQEGG